MDVRNWAAGVAGLAVWFGAASVVAQEAGAVAAEAAGAGDASAGVLPDPQAAEDGSEGPQPGKPWIGVQLARADEALRQQLGLEEGQGWVITEVFPDSPAAVAGVKKFDVVVAAGGKPLREDHDLSKAVKAAGGKAVALEVIRGGQRQTIEVTPKPAPAPPEPQWPKLVVSGLGQVDPLRTELPEGVEVEIKKSGSEVAHITVRRGRMVWEMIPGDSLERLPEDIRGPVASLLGRSDAASIRFLLKDGFPYPLGGLEGTVHHHSAPVDPGLPGRAVRPRPAAGVTPPRPPATRTTVPDLERRLDEIARRLDAIEKALSEKK